MNVFSPKKTGYILSLDFGTLSVRAGLYNIETGDLTAYLEREYAHGVETDSRFPGSALANPDDYTDAMFSLIADIIAQSGIVPAQVLGVGLDCTSCSPLIVDEKGVPLSHNPGFTDNPLAKIRLWKDISAGESCALMNNKATEDDDEWLFQCGGKISSGWMLPKLLQTYLSDPVLCAASASFVEAGDWLTWQLTGCGIRSEATAGFTGNRYMGKLMPPQKYLNSLAPGFGDYANKMLHGIYRPIGSIAGGLSKTAVMRTKLPYNTPVAVALMDSQAAAPALGLTEGDALLIMGTSSVFLLNTKEKMVIPGISSTVSNGIMPGHYGYAAGQNATGDMLDWYMHNALPTHIEKEASALHMSAHEYIQRQCADMQPGDTGLLALDWWNGYRNILKNPMLTGCIVGLTLSTEPRDIYLALLESAAFGAKTILRHIEESGIQLKRLVLDGGIAQRSPFIARLYSDIIGKRLDIYTGSNQSTRGCAILTAVAAGIYTLDEAILHMGAKHYNTYLPNIDRQLRYSELYTQYMRLHDYFGNEVPEIMEMLRGKSVLSNHIK